MPTIRYWAAAKAAAGVAEEHYDAATLADLVGAARAAHDGRLATVLDRCSWVVDDAPVGGRDHASVVLDADSVAEALPPFAGGASAGRRSGTIVA
jgi:molybdopterin converting factor small subunit